MELKTIIKEIDGLKFLIQQFPARKCKRLEIRTIKILAPIVNMLGGVKNLDSEINFDMITKSIQDILMNVDEDIFEKYMMDMVNYTSVELKNTDGRSIEIINLKDEQKFDIIFIGKSLAIYKLLIEIMKANKMFFFELMGGGGLNITSILAKAMSKQTKQTTELEKSES